MPTPPVSAEKRRQIVKLLKSGRSYREIKTELRCGHAVIMEVVAENGGVVPKVVERSPLRLSLAEREEISRQLVLGFSLRSVARSLSRDVATISREVANNGGRKKYRAWSAEDRALRCAKRPKPAKLLACPALRDVVGETLLKRYSPRQISRRLVVEHPNDPEMRISHEAIYQSLYVQGRGALRRELTAYLRSGRAIRRHQRRELTGARGRIKDMVMISERPPEAEDRAVPGHWEGDLIVGKNNGSCIGTLVERHTRYLMLMKLRDKKAETIQAALLEAVQRMPEELFKTLTWDQGLEMANHAMFSVESGVEVFFCDPHSPWQRGSNENTNGLLRQYFPKGTDLSGHSQQDLDAIAREMNDRPRETLGFLKPAEKLAELVALTA